mmetsp:Transcript_101192/g.123919  ORF Transcript_101192/g.123919 Transcript_101192/m.123919 type:complete len:139 (+) Transcript_101192:64-480(+)
MFNVFYLVVLIVIQNILIQSASLTGDEQLQEGIALAKELIRYYSEEDIQLLPDMFKHKNIIHAPPEAIAYYQMISNGQFKEALEQLKKLFKKYPTKELGVYEQMIKYYPEIIKLLKSHTTVSSLLPLEDRDETIESLD